MTSSDWSVRVDFDDAAMNHFESTLEVLKIIFLGYKKVKNCKRTINLHWKYFNKNFVWKRLRKFRKMKLSKSLVVIAQVTGKEIAFMKIEIKYSFFNNSYVGILRTSLSKFIWDDILTIFKKFLPRVIITHQSPSILQLSKMLKN